MDITQKRIPYHIFLIGFMGSGKTTVAQSLSSLLDMETLEMDAMIAGQQGMSIAEIFEKYGESYFRDLESRLLMDLQKEAPAVVSCGGGVVVRPENVRCMKEHGRIVLLTAAPETIFERVRYSRQRPILNDNMNVDFIRSLMEKRRESYLEAADLIIKTDGKSADDICKEMIESLE